MYRNDLVFFSFSFFSFPSSSTHDASNFSIVGGEIEEEIDFIGRIRARINYSARSRRFVDARAARF